MMRAIRVVTVQVLLSGLVACSALEPEDAERGEAATKKAPPSAQGADPFAICAKREQKDVCREAKLLGILHASDEEVTYKGASTALGELLHVRGPTHPLGRLEWLRLDVRAEPSGVWSIGIGGAVAAADGYEVEEIGRFTVSLKDGKVVRGSIKGDVTSTGKSASVANETKMIGTLFSSDTMVSLMGADGTLGDMLAAVGNEYRYLSITDQGDGFWDLELRTAGNTEGRVEKTGTFSVNFNVKNGKIDAAAFDRVD